MIVEFSRRKFLVSASGVALALPVLEALSPPKALAAAGDARRVIFYLTANGCPLTARPTGTGRNFDLGPVHSALERHKPDLLYIAGLDGVAATISKGDAHGCGLATTLSGRKCLPGTEFKDAACFALPTCPGTGWGDGPSLDYELGRQNTAVSTSATYALLNFSVKNTPRALTTRSSYSGPGIPITPDTDLRQTFDSIFSLPGVGGALARRLLRRKTIFDALKGDIAGLQQKVSTPDRARLEQHLTALREVELELDAIPAAPTCAGLARPELGAGPLVERNAGGMEMNPNNPVDEHLRERHEIWRQMMIAAFACDLTRVITFIAEPAGSHTYMPWLAGDPEYSGPFTQSHHTAGHSDDRPTQIGINRWYASQISALADGLKATLGPDGKPLFEASAIAWFNELSTGPDHSNVNKPHTIVGSLGGYFATDQIVKYPEGTPHNVLLTAIAQAMGMQTDHYGGTESALQGGDVALLRA